jgi:selenocysteine lyase/cysteine desulfurase
MAGTAAAIDYFAWVGETMADTATSDSRRQQICAGLDLLFDYEKLLAERLVGGLQDIPGVRIQGISVADAMDRRVPTVAFVHERHKSASIAEALAERNIFVWSGHNYALEVVRALDILESGGAVRIGAVHYNSVDEVDAALNALGDILT